MSFRLFKIVLCLGLLNLGFSQCEVIRALQTEIGSTPDASRTPTGNRSDERLDSKEMRLRQDIVDYAKRQLGAPYKYAGRNPQKGFDCSGLTCYVMDNFDIDLSPSSRAQESQGKKIAVSEVRPGDLIFFRRSRSGPVFHVALVVSNRPAGIEVIHSTSRGVVIDNISHSKYWKPKISTARNVISD